MTASFSRPMSVRSIYRINPEHDLRSRALAPSRQSGKPWERAFGSIIADIYEGP